MKKHLLLILFSLFVIAAFGQTKIYLTETLKKTETSNEIVYYRIFTVNPDSTVAFKDYFVDDNSLHIDGRFKDTSQKVFDGYFKFYDHGNLNSEGEIKNNGFEGKWKFYSISGKLKEEKIYADGNETGIVIKYYSNNHKRFIGKMISEKENGYCIYYHCGNEEKSSEGTFIDGVKNGFFKYYYVDGTIYSEGSYLNDKRIGTWIRYNTKGNIFCKVKFDSTSTTIQDKDSCIDKFMFQQKMPSYPGGEDGLMNWIGNNLKYPQEARKREIEGRVIVSFIVTITGKVENIEIEKTPSKLFVQPIMDLMSTIQTWTPGTQDGKPIDVYYTLPIQFTLQ